MDGRPELFALIAALASTHGATQVTLFGSRARKTNSVRSDIDLAIYGMPRAARSAFRFALEELPTLLMFDVVDIEDDSSAELLHEIERDGVTIYVYNEN